MVGAILVVAVDQTGTHRGWPREMPAKQGGIAKKVYPSPLVGWRVFFLPFFVLERREEAMVAHLDRSARQTIPAPDASGEQAAYRLPGYTDRGYTFESLPLQRGGQLGLV